MLVPGVAEFLVVDGDQMTLRDAQIMGASADMCLKMVHLLARAARSESDLAARTQNNSADSG